MCWPGCRAISSDWPNGGTNSPRRPFPVCGPFRDRRSLAAARRVADALAAWHRAGAGSGDLNFWRPYVEEFDSPQAYAWVIEALLEHRDLAASMALLMHWLSQADAVRLEEGPHSFHTLAERWLGMALLPLPQGEGRGEGEASIARQSPHPSPLPTGEGTNRLLGKFFDYLESNADTYWEVPESAAAEALLRPDGRSQPTERAEADEEQTDQSEEDVYGAAYDEMVYRDTTDDDIEGSMLEAPHGRDDPEVELEANQLVRRLAFLRTVARLWRRAGAGRGRTTSGRSTTD